jgi:methylglutaconyl-CoA hydratase
VDGTHYSTIIAEHAGKVARITLNRPEVHNAFTAAMIRELRDAVRCAASDAEVRVVVLTGTGTSFCAGADLNWMREIIFASYEQNYAESLAVAEFHEELYSLPKPTIARVNGTAIGGGTGFLSACDIVVASSEAKFGLSEVKLGLVPAAISPYVVRRIGESQARRYFLTGERIDARRAQEIGLVNIVVPPEDIDHRTNELITSLLSSGPEALAKVKELLHRVPGMPFEEAKAYTAAMIAALRVSGEGQEGMSAFLERRKPKWAD